MVGCFFFCFFSTAFFHCALLHEGCALLLGSVHCYMGRGCALLHGEGVCIVTWRGCVLIHGVCIVSWGCALLHGVRIVTWGFALLHDGCALLLVRYIHGSSSRVG